MQTFIRSSCKLSRIINLIEKRSIHSSIDPKEIEHHSNLAKIWWDLDGPLAALHTLNTIRYIFNFFGDFKIYYYTLYDSLQRRVN